MKQKKRRKRYSEGGGDFLLGLLTMPVLGMPRLTHWVAGKMSEEINRESLDQGRVRGELLELQQRYDVVDIDEEDYDQQEKGLLEELSAIREYEARQNQVA